MHNTVPDLMREMQRIARVSDDYHVDYNNAVIKNVGMQEAQVPRKNDTNLLDTFVFMHTGNTREPAWVCMGVEQWLSQFVKSTDGKCRKQYRHAVSLTPYSNFIGGSLSFWSSPEVLALARSYRDYPDGMWRHRWGDQQWWYSVLPLFFRGSTTSANMPQDGVVLDRSKWRKRIFRHK